MSPPHDTKVNAPLRGAALPSAQPMSMLDKTAPKANLSVLDGVAMMVGIIVGIGIFKTPALVAANVTSEAAVLGLWMLGGAVTLVGALVYAEFGSAYPSCGASTGCPRSERGG